MRTMDYTLSVIGCEDEDKIYEEKIPHILWIRTHDLRFWYKSFIEDINGMEIDFISRYAEEYRNNFLQLLYEEKHYTTERSLLKHLIDVINKLTEITCNQRAVVTIDAIFNSTD